MPRARLSSRISPNSKRAGLLLRIDRPINKDTELHPLVRWQFLGGMPEEERRAFLFTNVVDAQGPAIRHSGGGRCAGRFAAKSTRSAWDARSKRSAPPGCTRSRIPIAPVRDQGRAVPGSGDHAAMSCASSGGGLASCRCRFRRRASMPRRISRRRCASRAIRKPACRTWAPTAPRSRPPTGSACAWRRALGGAGGYLHWLQIPRPQAADAVRHRDRLRAGGRVHRAAKVPDRTSTKMAVAGGARRRSRSAW